MTQPLTLPEVRARLHNFTAQHYTFFASVIKGIALAIAAEVGLKILSGWPGTVALLPLWFASIAAVLVSYTTWARGVILTNARLSFGDHVAPLVMGLFEFAMFRVLDPGNTQGQVAPPLLWFALSGLHASSAVLLVISRIWSAKLVDFDPILHPVRLKYIKWMWGDVLGAALGAILSFATLLFLARWPHVYVACGSATVAFAAMLNASIRADRQRHEIDTLTT